MDSQSAKSSAFNFCLIITKICELLKINLRLRRDTIAPFAGSLQKDVGQRHDKSKDVDSTTNNRYRSNKIHAFSANIIEQ